ncbi:MAG: hypothetical protein QXS91_00025 [Candidatus Anstonellales archaeon]
METTSFSYPAGFNEPTSQLYQSFDPNNKDDIEREKKAAKDYPLIPSLMLSFLPVVGPVIDLIKALEEGKYLEASMYAGFLVSDLFLVGYAAKLPFKFAIRYLTIDQIADIFRLGYKAIKKLKEAGKAVPKELERFYKYLHDLGDIIAEMKQEGAMSQKLKEYRRVLEEIRGAIKMRIKEMGLYHYFEARRLEKEKFLESLRTYIEQEIKIGGNILKALKGDQRISGYALLLDKSGMWKLNMLLGKAGGDIALGLYNRAIKETIKEFGELIKKAEISEEDILIIYKPAGGDEFYLHFLSTDPSKAEKAAALFVELVKEKIQKGIIELEALLPPGLAHQLKQSINEMLNGLAWHGKRVNIEPKGNVIKFFSPHGEISGIPEYLGEVEFEKLRSNLPEKIADFFDGFRRALKSVKETVPLNVVDVEKAVKALKEGSAKLIRFELIIPSKFSRHFDALTRAAEKGYSVTFNRAGPSVFNLLGHDVTDTIRDLYIKSLKEAAKEIGVDIEISAIDGKGPFTLLVKLSDEKKLNELMERARRIFESYENISRYRFRLSQEAVSRFEDLSSPIKKVYEEINKVSSENPTIKRRINEWTTRLGVRENEALERMFNTSLILIKTHYDKFSNLIGRMNIPYELKKAIKEFAEDKRARSLEDFSSILEKYKQTGEFIRLLFTREVSLLLLEFLYNPERFSEKEKQPKQPKTLGRGDFGQPTTEYMPPPERLKK